MIALDWLLEYYESLSLVVRASLIFIEILLEVD